METNLKLMNAWKEKYKKIKRHLIYEKVPKSKETQHVGQKTQPMTAHMGCFFFHLMIRFEESNIL